MLKGLKVNLKKRVLVRQNAIEIDNHSDRSENNDSKSEATPAKSTKQEDDLGPVDEEQKVVGKKMAIGLRLLMKKRTQAK